MKRDEPEPPSVRASSNFEQRGPSSRMRAPYYWCDWGGIVALGGLKVSCFHSWTFCHHHLFVWIAIIAQYDDIHIYIYIYILNCIYIYAYYIQ